MAIIYIYICVYIYIYICYVYIYIYIYILCMCVYIYIYAHLHLIVSISISYITAIINACGELWPPGHEAALSDMQGALETKPRASCWWKVPAGE